MLVNQYRKRGIRWHGNGLRACNRDVAFIVLGDGKVGNAVNRVNLLKLNSRGAPAPMERTGYPNSRHLVIRLGIIGSEDPLLMGENKTAWFGEQRIGKTEPRRNAYCHRGDYRNKSRNARLGKECPDNTNQAGHC